MGELHLAAPFLGRKRSRRPAAGLEGSALHSRPPRSGRKIPPESGLSREELLGSGCRLDGRVPPQRRNPPESCFNSAAPFPGRKSATLPDQAVRSPCCSIRPPRSRDGRDPSARLHRQPGPQLQFGCPVPGTGRGARRHAWKHDERSASIRPPRSRDGRVGREGAVLTTGTIASIRPPRSRDGRADAFSQLRTEIDKLQFGRPVPGTEEPRAGSDDEVKTVRFNSAAPFPGRKSRLRKRPGTLAGRLQFGRPVPGTEELSSSQPRKRPSPAASIRPPRSRDGRVRWQRASSPR